MPELVHVDPGADVGAAQPWRWRAASPVGSREHAAAAGFDDVRDSHGYVVQGLLAGDTTVIALAGRLGVERTGGVEVRDRAGARRLRAPWSRPRRRPGASAAAHRAWERTGRRRRAVPPGSRRELGKWLRHARPGRAGAPAPARGRAPRWARRAHHPEVATAVVQAATGEAHRHALVAVVEVRPDAHRVAGELDRRRTSRAAPRRTPALRAGRGARRGRSARRCRTTGAGSGGGGCRTRCGSSNTSSSRLADV